MDTTATVSPTRAIKSALPVLLIVAFLLLVWAAYTFLPVNVTWHEGVKWIAGTDWQVSFRPATLKLYSGVNPYERWIYNPPWTFLPFLPVALLPAGVGSAVMFALCFLGFGFAAHRMHAAPLEIACILLSPPVILCAWQGQLDWLVALGFSLPPQIGLFFVLAKPQTGIVVVLLWLLQAWQRGKLWEVIRVFGPVAVALVLSVILYGKWFTGKFDPLGASWNLSFFPYTIPVGLILLFRAISKEDFRLSIFASAFLSPYVAIYSWSVTLFGLIGNRYEPLIAFMGLWLAEALGAHWIPLPPV